MPSRKTAGPKAPGSVPHVLPRKIFALALIPSLVVTLTATVLIQTEVGNRMRQHTREQLETAEVVWRDLYAAEAQDLVTQGAVVARDPKFFALLDQPDLSHDESYRATLRALADEFHTTLGGDFFEVLDDEGMTLVSWDESREDLRPDSPDVDAALRGRTMTTSLSVNGSLYQVATVPVTVRNRLVGVLRHGRRVDDALAQKVRRMTRCEITFLSDGAVVASSKIGGDDRYLAIEDPLPDRLTPFDASVRLERSIEREQAFLARLRMGLLAAGAATLALSLLLAQWLTRRITSPVQKLVRAAVRLEQGDTELPIEIATGDELEYLGRRFEEMRSALNEKIRSLEELDRMKSNFLTLASHELRTPATLINGAVYLIEAVVPQSNAELKKVLDALREGVVRLERVVQQITDMTLLDRDQLAMTLAATDMRDVIEPLAQQWETMRAGRALSLRIERPERPLHVEADAPRLGQAVANLLANAVRFTPDDGHITLGVFENGDWARIVVADTGVGIAEAQRERVFEHFYEARDILSHRSGRTEFGSSGLGVGLAITRRIVEGHSGRIWCEPNPGGGTRFVIELPLAAARSGDGDASSDLAA